MARISATLVLAFLVDAFACACPMAIDYGQFNYISESAQYNVISTQGDVSDERCGHVVDVESYSNADSVSFSGEDIDGQASWSTDVSLSKNRFAIHLRAESTVSTNPAFFENGYTYVDFVGSSYLSVGFEVDTSKRYSVLGTISTTYTGDVQSNADFELIIAAGSSDFTSGFVSSTFPTSPMVAERTIKSSGFFEPGIYSIQFGAYSKSIPFHFSDYTSSAISTIDLEIVFPEPYSISLLLIAAGSFIGLHRN